LGAAIDAAVGLGLDPDLETAIATMTRTGESSEPNTANHQIYNELYQRVYLKMYSQLKPLYEEIRNITGYPPKL
jgi:ribulose kinase